jgi:hypothetical protein
MKLLKLSSCSCLFIDARRESPAALVHKKNIKRTFELYISNGLRQQEHGRQAFTPPALSVASMRKKTPETGVFVCAVPPDQNAMEYCAPRIQTLES